MTNYDVDLELKEQKISLYEDELSIFIDRYRNDKEFRELIKKKYDARIVYEEMDECYGLYFGEDITFMTRSIEECLEKMFNFIKNQEYSKQLLENQLRCIPF